MSWKVLIFLLAFQIDVRVKANFMDQPMGEPAKCWMESEGPCSVQAGKQPLVLKSKDLNLWAERDSLFDREEGAWRLLKGSVRGRTESAAQFKFPFGEVSTQGGEFWVLEDGEKFFVRAVSSALQITTKSGKQLELPEGLEIWVGPMNRLGVSSHGVPSLIPLEDHLRRWSSLNDLSKDEFVSQAQELKARWKNRQLMAASLYEKVTERHLASIAEEKETERRKQERESAQRERFRKLLYERAFER